MTEKSRNLTNPNKNVFEITRENFMATKQSVTKKLEELANEIKVLREMELAEIKKLREDLTMQLARPARGTRQNLNNAASGAMVIAGSDMVLKDIQDHPGAARQEIVQRTNLKPIQVTKIVSDLQDQAKLVKLGNRRTTRWFTKESLDALQGASPKSS